MTTPILIVGLGNHENAEKRHARPLRGTRHNAGFELVDRLRAHLGLTWTQGQGSLHTGVSTLAGLSVMLAAPNRTDLNGSGGDLQRDFPAPQRILTVLDDLDLPPGELRYRDRGSSGGHRGLDDVTTVYGDQPRLRIGIGRPPEGHSVLTHVMSPLSPACLAALDAALPDVLGVLTTHLPRHPLLLTGVN